MPETTAPPHNRARFALPALLLLIFAAQCAWFIETQSMTVDEPSHLLSGFNGWRESQFKERDDNPPGPRLWFTLLLRDPEWQIEKDGGRPVEAIRPTPEMLMRRARGMVVLLGLVSGALLWMAARRFFSEGAANFALALFAISPPLIANFSLATHDAPVSLMIFAAAHALVCWGHQPSWGRTIGLGLVMGCMLVSKHSAAPMFALAFGLLLVLKPDSLALNPMHWNWGKGLAVLGVAFLVVWGTYFFHVSQATLRDGFLTMTFPNFNRPLEKQLPGRVNATLYIPAAEYLTGLQNVVKNSRLGFRTYFLGEAARGGRRMFFPVVLALKWPTVILLTALWGAALLCLRRVAGSRDLLVMMLFPVAYFLLSVSSNMNYGDRHILPVYPFLLLLAAGTWEWARRKRLYAGALVLLLALQAGDTLRYAPDYLSYFNPFVKPAESWKLLADSNLDWGQGLIALKKYQDEHPNETIHFAYFGIVNPRVYGLNVEKLVPGERVTGTVVVSASHLAGHALQDQQSYRWVLQYPRKAILNHTLHVFEVPADVSP